MVFCFSLFMPAVFSACFSKVGVLYWRTDKKMARGENPVVIKWFITSALS